MPTRFSHFAGDFWDSSEANSDTNDKTLTNKTSDNDELFTPDKLEQYFWFYPLFLHNVQIHPQQFSTQTVGLKFSLENVYYSYVAGTSVHFWGASNVCTRNMLPMLLYSWNHNYWGWKRRVGIMLGGGGLIAGKCPLLGASPVCTIYIFI